MEKEGGRRGRVRPWKEWEVNYLFENIHKRGIPEICSHLKRNERSVNLYLHRHQFDPRILKDNLLLRILTLKFNGDPTLFRPNRKFYDSINMSQKRFYAILKGHEVMKDEECKRIVDFFKIEYDSIIQLRQLQLFTDPETKNR